MNLTEDEIRERIDRYLENIEKNHRWWEEGKIEDHAIPNHWYALAIRYQSLAGYHALLGDGTAAREAYSESATYYVKSVQETWERIGQLEPSDWESQPAVLVRAMTAGQLADDGDVTADAAREALAMDDAYLDEFAPTYDDAPFRYYNAKLRAAVTLDDDRQTELLAAYREALKPLNNPYAEAMGTVYEAIIDGDEDGALEGLEDLLSYHEETVQAGTDNIEDYIADMPASLCLLARDRGLDVTIAAEFVPDVLVPREAAAVAVLSNRESWLEEAWDEGQTEQDRDVPHVERDDETGGYVVVETVTHPGGRDLTAEDLPMTDNGRLLSDEWLDAEIADLLERDEEFPRALGEELRAAREEGSLKRKLVVVEAESGQYLFDDSIGELGIDHVSMVKGVDDSA